MPIDDTRDLLREPAHAGTFYPASAAVLARLVDEQLAGATRRAAGDGGLSEGRRPAGSSPTVAHPVGFVVPHAGLVYSGPVAAAAWSTLRDRPPAAIVIAGTNHYVGGWQGVGVWPAGAWHTPLADVPVDAALADRVVALGRPFAALPRVHLREHSIEVQLPFVVRACPDVPIVPMLVTFGDEAACLGAGARLGGLLRELRSAGQDVVLAASTDFAHYPAARDAEAVTEALLPALLARDAVGLVRRERALLDEAIPGLACGMCGIEPAAFALAAFEAMGLDDGVVLATATSADVPGGDRYRTVGYAAVAFSRRAAPPAAGPDEAASPAAEPDAAPSPAAGSEEAASPAARSDEAASAGRRAQTP